MTKSLINKFLDSLDKQNWELKTLEEISIDIFSGRGVEDHEKSSHGILAVKSGNITEIKGIYLEEKEISTFINRDSLKNLRTFTKNDIVLVSQSGSINKIGKSFLYLGNNECVAGSALFVIKHNQNPFYLIHVLNNSQFLKKFKKLVVEKATKGTPLRISINEFRKIKIPLPPRHIQDTIADLLDQWTRLDAELTTELNARLEQWGYYKNNLITKIISLQK